MITTTISSPCIKVIKLKLNTRTIYQAKNNSNNKTR